MASGRASGVAVDGAGRLVECRARCESRSTGRSPFQRWRCFDCVCLGAFQSAAGHRETPGPQPAGSLQCGRWWPKSQAGWRLWAGCPLAATAGRARVGRLQVGPRSRHGEGATGCTGCSWSVQRCNLQRVQPLCARVAGRFTQTWSGAEGCLHAVQRLLPQHGQRGGRRPLLLSRP
jgi:hypothetical protein